MEGAVNIRASSNETSRTLALALEDRQTLNERRYLDDKHQRELDREEKQKDREAAREFARESNIVLASVISRIIPGASSSSSETAITRHGKKCVELQYHPEVGSEPFPLLVTLTTLQGLLR